MLIRLILSVPLYQNSDLPTSAILVHISICLRFDIAEITFARSTCCNEEELRHYDNLIARKIIFLDCFSKHYFGETVRINICGIKRLNPGIVSRPYVAWISVSYFRKLNTYAALMCFSPSSSPRTHGSHSGDPYDMHPSIIFDTLKPEFPRRTMMSGTTMSIS